MQENLGRLSSFAQQLSEDGFKRVVVLGMGGPPNGLFVQFVSTSLSAVVIPDEAGRPETQNTFGKLKLAQAQGDAQALLNGRRRVMRFRLSNNAEGDLRQLLREVSSSVPCSFLQPV
jgi:hypothetical protein